MIKFEWRGSENDPSGIARFENWPVVIEIPFSHFGVANEFYRFIKDACRDSYLQGQNDLWAAIKTTQKTVME